MEVMREFRVPTQRRGEGAELQEILDDFGSLSNISYFDNLSRLPTINFHDLSRIPSSECFFINQFSLARYFDDIE